MLHTTSLLTMLTSMELKAAPLHSDWYGIGSVSECEAVKGITGITEIVVKEGTRLVRLKVGGEGVRCGGWEERVIIRKIYQRMMWMGKCSN